jgi:lipopolysaccharide export system protein LptA
MKQAIIKPVAKAWLILVMCLSVVGTPALALESDADQAITIDSDTATYDDAAEISTYTGNVVSTQGSIRVESDKLVVYLKKGDAEKLIFVGKPAKFKQTPSQGGEDIKGEALTGEYYPKQKLLVLIDQASVTQGNAMYTSQLIEYDIKSALVKAGEKSSGTKRVHAILKPRKEK